MARHEVLRHDLCDLKDFNGSIVALDYLLENWLTPQLSVGPAPRVHIPDRAAEQMRDSLGKLQPLAADWSPTDPTGQIVTGGWGCSIATCTQNLDFTFARYNTNGTLDASFGTGGKATVAVSTGRDEARGHTSHRSDVGQADAP